MSCRAAAAAEAAAKSAVPCWSRTAAPRWYRPPGQAANRPPGSSNAGPPTTRTISFGHRRPTRLPLHIGRGVLYPRFATSSSRSTKRRSPTVSRSDQTAAEGRRGSVMSDRTFLEEDLTHMRGTLEAGIDMLGSVFSADECLGILAAVQRCQQNPRSYTEDELERNHGLTLYEIHTVGVLLQCGARAVPDSNQRCRLLGRALLYMAATTSTNQDHRTGTRGYLPSTLTLVFQHSVQPPGGPIGRRPQSANDPYPIVERQFLAYLDRNKTPLSLSSESSATSPSLVTVDDLVLQADAFTLAGMLAETGGNPDRALRWYRAAREVGNNLPLPDDSVADDRYRRSPRWTWERRCLESVGRLLVASGRTEANTPDGEEALDAVQTAALALDSEEATMLLATAFAKKGMISDENAVQLLRQASSKAFPGAATAMAAHEDRKAAMAAAGTPRTRHGDVARNELTEKEHKMLADEWRSVEASITAAEGDVLETRKTLQTIAERRRR
ncbi:hypothetical protein SPI_09058 [Niveomyces insectorum RCEF 264]|uniref:Uncharacterized protein n=1 Tax=Niveomyces insectorum RCEF 264 TaxID=1081102 RepID=A0A167MA46_9HYPO|nr:hypothetical protein SPI_09058 [Niveomyces insectorum RCEF 264]